MTKKTEGIISPFNFNPFLPKISSVLNKHFKSLLFKKPELKPVFGDAPMAALRQPPNLRKFLCRSKLYPISREERFSRTCRKNAPGWKKCGKGTTTCCPFALPPKVSDQVVVVGFCNFALAHK